MGGRDESGSRFQRLANFILLPDGSRAWFDHGHLVRSTAGGGTRVLPDSELANGDGWIGDQTAYGHGAWLGPNTCYDAIREQRFTLPQGTLVRWIHDGTCIVLDARGKPPLGSFSQLWNIETQKLAPIPGLETGEAALAMVDDGRLIVGPWPLRKATAWQVALLDPKSGTREPIPLPASAADAMPGISIQTRTPAGLPVMSLYSEKEQLWRFARFDLAARRFDLLATGVATPLSLVGCADEESAVMSDGRRLLRAWFTKPGVEVLFPRPEQ
jgi:hypothetical protein